MTRQFPPGPWLRLVVDRGVRLGVMSQQAEAARRGGQDAADGEGSGRKAAESTGPKKAIRVRGSTKEIPEGLARATRGRFSSMVAFNGG